MYEVCYEELNERLFNLIGITHITEEPLGQSETCSLSACSSTSTQFDGEFLSREEMEI